jgi:hypothetical protein
MQVPGHRIYVLLPALVFALIVLAAGCESTAPVVVPADIPGGTVEVKPSWIDSYPTDKEYYIGIGASKSGSQGEDMETARAKALADLASSISTKIKSELLIVAGQSSTGGAYEAVDQVIRESVDAHIREVEVMDTYYSDEMGYWFYLRLNKSEWESIQKEEMERLSRRVVGIVEPVISDSSKPITARLQACWKGWLLLHESPYSGLIETSLSGKAGVLIDLVENELLALTDSLRLEAQPEVVQAQPGNPFSVRFFVRSSTGYRPGVFTIVLSYPGIDAAAVRVTTDGDGAYRGVISNPLTRPGVGKIAARLDFESIGLLPAWFPGGLSAPESEIMLDVSAFTANLSVDTPDGFGIDGAVSAIESLLTSQLPIEVAQTAKAQYTVHVKLVGREGPTNDYGIIIAYLKAAITVSRDGMVIESYQSPEVKEGGLDLGQAYARGFNKLMESLNNSSGWLEDIEKALYN